MNVLLIIISYIVLGIAFAAWTKAKDKMPESFDGDRDDEQLWVLLCALFWIFIAIGYLVMALYDYITNAFQGDKEDDRN